MIWNAAQKAIDEAAIRKLILEEWSRKRIVKFCTHLMGDRCQRCVAEEEAAPAVKNSIYQAVSKITEEREANGSYRGNGHHLAQEITKAVEAALKPAEGISRKENKCK